MDGRSGPFFVGRRQEQGEVLYLALEDGKRRLQNRLNILLGKNQPPAKLHLVDATSGWKILNQGGLDMLKKTITDYPNLKLIAIDTLQKIKPTGSRQNNAYENDYKAIGDLQKLAIEKNIGIILIHHLRKSISRDGDIFDEISGSLGLSGSSDTIMVIKRKRNSDDAVLAVSGRDILERELAMHFDNTVCKWSIVGDAKDTCITMERLEILDVLRETTGTLDAQEIHGGLEQRGISKSPATVRWLLRQMVEAGEIENPAKGKYCITNAVPTNKPTSKQEGLFPDNHSGLNKQTNKQTNQQTNKCDDEHDDLLLEPKSSLSSELPF